jgi:hypothetical protein
MISSVHPFFSVKNDSYENIRQNGVIVESLTGVINSIVSGEISVESWCNEKSLETIIHNLNCCTSYFLFVESNGQKTHTLLEYTDNMLKRYGKRTITKNYSVFERLLIINKYLVVNYHRLLLKDNKFFPENVRECEEKLLNNNKVLEEDLLMVLTGHQELFKIDNVEMVFGLCLNMIGAYIKFFNRKFQVLANFNPNNNDEIYDKLTVNLIVSCSILEVAFQILTIDKNMSMAILSLIVDIIKSTIDMSKLSMSNSIYKHIFINRLSVVIHVLEKNNNDCQEIKELFTFVNGNDNFPLSILHYSKDNNMLYPKIKEETNNIIMFTVFAQ